MAPFSVLFFLFLASSSVSAAPCNPLCLHKSKAGYFPLSKAVIPPGACGYGSIAKSFNKGYIAAGIPSLLGENGVACGSCLHVTCKNKTLCRGRGTNVVLTCSLPKIKDLANIDLILSDRAYISMAAKGKARELLALKTVDVDYIRVPCEYKNHNLSVRVDKSSKKPDHLVLTFLNQGGQTGIHMVTVYALNNFTRIERDMDHKRGAVWEMKNTPQGSLSFRLFVYSGYDRSFVYSNKDLPADWKVGKIYDLGVQMNDRMDKRDGCTPNCTD
ncbi:hypothetical protein C5167_014859 [Papaver somniferum]|uniref:Expansin-like EG45 domain-containing protein n=1 Tax=Papaver somniferum TaxID=3469 RepID=A0A4Y7J7I2_PAPSO|nr:expansin-like A2 [Papaver somniferum]RZC56010.1 hypothetical protein C5167_014859 [Papaver somniferum]